MIRTAIAATLSLAFAAGAAFAQTSGSTSGTTSGTTSGSAQKMSQAQCQSMWQSADSSKAGSLTQTQAKPYVSSFSTVDTNSDGKLSQAEFMSACDKGQVMASGSGSTTGTTGSSTGSASGTAGSGTGSTGAGTSSGTGTTGKTK